MATTTDFTDTDKATMASLFLAGTTMKDIAARFGTNWNRVWGILNAQGVDLKAGKVSDKPARKPRKPAAGQADAAELEALRAELTLARDTAARYAADKDRLTEELRLAHSRRPAGTTNGETPAQVARRVIKGSYGKLSRKYHPDMGGTADRQMIVNECFQDLLERLESL